MIGKTKGKSFSSVDSHRKKQRAKEIKKNKLKKDFEKASKGLNLGNEELLAQLHEIERHEKNGSINKVMKQKKKLILQIIGDQKVETKQQTKKENTDLHTLYPYPKMSIYYHPVKNPYGAPPPGMPMTYIGGFNPNDDQNSILDMDNVDNIPPPPEDGDDKNIPRPLQLDKLGSNSNINRPPPMPQIPLPPHMIPIPMHPNMPPFHAHRFGSAPQSEKKQQHFSNDFKASPVKKFKKTDDDEENQQNDKVENIEEVTHFIPKSVLMKRQMRK